MNSLKVNFALTAIRTTLTFLLPIITFPYISRVLEPSGIGKVEFANSIVSYFVLFTALGVPTYGMREIARVRDNIKNLSKTVFELSFMLLITTSIGYIIYFIIIRSFSYFYVQRNIFYIIAPTIFLSSFNFDWFYQGIENQTYITIRFIVVKVLQIIAIFLLIKNTEHFLRYAAISVGLNGFSSFFNILYLRKYIKKSAFKELDFSRHIKSVLIIFTSIIAVNIYMQLDITMVGVFCSDTEVGLYTAANRIVRIAIAIVTMFCSVITPRLENCLKNNNINSYNRYLNLSFRYILLFAIPFFLGINAIAGDIIALFAGEQYLPAVVTIKLLSPIIILVGLASFVGLQLLYLNRKEYKYTIAVSVSAVLNTIVNAILIPLFAQNGAAIGTIIAESTGLFIQIIFARKYFKAIDFFSFNSLKFLISGIVMYLAVRNVPYINENIFFHCVVCIVFGAIIYASSLIILREKLSIEIVHLLQIRLFRNPE